MPYIIQEQLQHINEIQLPQVASSFFIFHTLKVANGKRNALAAFLKTKWYRNNGKLSYPLSAKCLFAKYLFSKYKKEA